MNISADCASDSVPTVPGSSLTRLALSLRHVLKLGTLVFAVACSSSAQTADRVDQASQAVDAAIGSPRCQSDRDCRVIGIGARACGGPEFYRAWSVRATRESVLVAAVNKHAALRRAADEAEGISSPCVVEPVPQARCDKPVGKSWGVCIASRSSMGQQGGADLR